MDKITEALKNILPEDHVNEVSKAVVEMMEEHNATLEKEFNEKLEEAYTQLSEERKKDEAIAEEGYQQAYEIINDLMARLDQQKAEFNEALEEGFEEAYQELEKERSKNDDVESKVYEDFDNRLQEMRSFMIDKVDQFLGEQEKEMYEEARSNVLSDPTIAEQRVAVNKMAEILANYMDREDLNGLTSSKLEEATGQINELKRELRIVESRNLKLSAQNTRLNEQVSEAEGLISEAVATRKKERAEKASNARPRGNRVLQEQLIAEQGTNNPSNNDQTLTEGNDELGDLLTLSGIPTE